MDGGFGVEVVDGDEVVGIADYARGGEEFWGMGVCSKTGAACEGPRGCWSFGF